MSDRPQRDPYDVLQILPTADQIVVRAAFRALAGRYHPDNDSDPAATARMAELNAAYAQIGTPDRRAVHDARQRHMAATPTVIVPPPQPAGPRGIAKRATATPEGGVLDFGRYDGWSLADIAKQDPDYLRWLARHSSGIRYRREIERLLQPAEPLRASPDRKRRR